jgi:hypothetical protein
VQSEQGLDFTPVDRMIANSSVENPLEEFENFRAEGALGEYQEGADNE